MKQVFLVMLIVGWSLPAWAQKKAAVLYPALSTTIDSLAAVDQHPMQTMMRSALADSTRTRLIAEQHVNFARHQPILETIVMKYGFPGFKQVGEASSRNFWLLVQHADAHQPFQQQVLKLMLPQVQQKNADGKNYAYLSDRVALNSGQPQEFGTQVSYNADGQPVPRNLRDPATVNQRRAAVGMESLEAYLAKIREVQRQSRQSKQ